METQPNNGAAAAPTALTPYQARQIELREYITQDAAPRAIVPRTFAEAQAFAQAMANSSLVPEALRERAADIMMIILAGAELEIAPVRSLSMFHVIEGVPKLSADALAAIVSASPICEILEPVEQTNERVTWLAKKRGRPEIRLSWTDADVKAANLDRPARSGRPSNHVLYPRAMKNARCKAELCRMVFPEICAGLLTAEEARDLIDTREEAAPTKAAQFSVPPPAPASPTATSSPTTSAPPGKPQGGKSTDGKKGAPIDTTATEGGASTTTAGSNTSPTTKTTGSAPPYDADAAREAAFAKAREGNEAIAQANARAAANEANRTQRDPQVITPPAGKDNATASGELGPTSQDKAPEATGEDVSIPATTDAVDPGVASPAPDEDGFGGESTPARSIERFESEVARCVSDKATDRLEAIKRDWIPWSKDETATGGKQYAHRMRDAFAKAKADLGIR